MTDHSDIKQIEEGLKKAVDRIHSLAPLVGNAKQIREYDSDRRKNLLATYALPYLKAGHSVASAELEARATPAYQTQLESLSEQREASEKTIAEWEAAFAGFEARRSMYSMHKTMVGLE